MNRRWHFPIKPWQVKLIERGWRSDPITIGILTATIGTLAVAGGVYEGINAIAGGNKEKKAQSDLLGAAPAAPDPNAAATQAEATLTQNRRTLLASGGNTDVTGGAPILTGNTKSNILLGG
jgi:hypothetical protein